MLNRGLRIVTCAIFVAGLSSPGLAEVPDEPGIELRPAVAASAQLKKAPSPKRKSLQPPSDATRLLHGSTAFSAEKGTLNWTMFNLGLHQFDVQATDNLNFGLTTIVPAGVVAFIGHGIANFEVSPNVHLGVKAQGGVLHSFLGDNNATAGFWGGGVMASFGSEDLFLNTGFSAYGLAADGDTLTVFVPHIGGS